MIRPDGWVVPPAAEKIHGLSTDLCQRCGIPLDVAWSVLSSFAAHADLLVAHSVAFDRFILDSEWLRQRDVLPPLEGIWYCTKEAATPVLKLPSKHPGSEYGWPSLTEAHNFFCGIGITGAHDALVDAEACARVYYALQNRTETLHE
jgi:DNA polymerase III epsilon subunit-like protein